MQSPERESRSDASDGETYYYVDYNDSPDPSHRPLYLKTVLNFLKPLKKGATVFDAGCGGGDFAIGLAEAGYIVFGSDMSPSGVAHARSLNVGKFEVASIYSPLAAPFERKSFDAIVCIEVIEHLYSPVTFAKRAYEALEPGGIIILTTPYWGYFKNIVLAVTNRMDRSLTALWEGGHIKHFSRATLGQLMTERGFETIGFEGCGEGWRAHFPGLWNGMAMAFRKPVLSRHDT